MDKQQIEMTERAAWDDGRRMYGGKRPWIEESEWQRPMKRKEMAPLRLMTSNLDGRQVVVSSPSSSEKFDEIDDKMKGNNGKKRNRMKDEIDSLRKEILQMTHHLEAIKQGHETRPRHGRHSMWADIAKQQEIELGKVVMENQQLRQTLEEHLNIAQDYLDTILPKQAPQQPTAKDALPVIMCL
ncbi:hypothetical protein THRCLA_21839 [Thraustotheca clavata]|uniref:Uncharacterized protein n=1 Tax=Thraustotheca clavata TaxID=74557 RepID=A0A1V9ZNB8_9STRA|nr:hypothetical protein THRCLA_21839 [Thraustotheca clavata]